MLNNIKNIYFKTEKLDVFQNVIKVYTEHSRSVAYNFVHFSVLVIWWHKYKYLKNVRVQALITLLFESY